MSRVHDALRRAEQVPAPGQPTGRVAAALTSVAALTPANPVDNPPPTAALLEQVRVVPFKPEPDCHLIDVMRPQQSPTEEFRSLRTRLNHLQSQRPLHSLVVTSSSPAEGKSFTAANLALAESHLQGNNTLLCDFDFRRPTVHSLFSIPRVPGLTDYLLGRSSLTEIISRVAGTNLYLAPAGTPVLNPLELLNLKEVRVLFDRLPQVFNWVILDSPPLLFAADANLLSTLVDGTLLVVRLGQSSIDNLSRALSSMSHNNVIGVVANGAKRGELYSKYTHYHSYYEDSSAEPGDDGEAAASEEAEREAEAPK